VDISADHVRAALFYVIAFVVSVSIHEFGHAFIADRLGDRIPRLQGRLTLSPLAHIDPLGTLAVPLLGAMMGLPLFAWGKPVQTNPGNYTRRL
jgi:Zn-dependent protease